MVSGILPPKLIVCIFGIFVALAAFPLGGNIPLAWAINGLAVSIFLMWFAVGAGLSGNVLPVPVKRIRFVLCLYIIICIIVYIQSSFWLSDIFVHPIWGEAGRALPQKLQGAISINPSDTIIGLMRLLTYGGVFWLALQFGRDVKQANLILKILGVAILLNALYAMFLWSSGYQTILWFDKWVGKEEVTGTFVNRNHFASYIAMGCIIWLSFVLRACEQLFRRLSGVRPKYYFDTIIEEIFVCNGIYILGFFILFGVLLLSRSRAGFLCACIGMLSVILCSGLAWLKHTQNRRVSLFSVASRFVGGVSAVFISGLGVLVLFQGLGGSRLLSRLLNENSVDYERVGVFRKVVEAIADSPLLGSGFGTFSDIFPIYRDSVLSAYGRWNQAHNTYLENMMELGIPVAFLLFLTVGWCVYRCFIGAFWRQKHQNFAQIGLCVSIMVLLHSLIDFPLQISGITITYITLLALGVSQSWSSRML